jgi:hypothetical protein
MMVKNPEGSCLPALLKSMGLILAVSVLSACATTQKTDLEDYIGLYEVADPKCHAVEQSTDPCEGILFFELVKGRFMGIGDTDLAYVFWSGDPTIDPELQYSAFLIGHAHSAKIEEGEFRLNAYSAQYASGRSVQYALKPVSRGALAHVRLNYPGNE